MKRIIVFLIVGEILLCRNYTFAAVNEIIEEQKENFGISSFIREAEKYSGDFFEEMSVSDMLNSAITRKIDNSTIFKKLFSFIRRRSNRKLTNIS